GLRPASGRDGPAVRAGRLILRDRLELVADAVARLDEGVPTGTTVDLLAQAADEDVDGPIAVRLAAAPELLQQLVACGDAAAVDRELVEEAEPGRGQPRALAGD